MGMNPQWHYTPLVIPMGFSIGLIIALMFLGYRQRQNPLALPFLLLMGESLIWMSMSLLEVSTLNLELSLFFADASFLGITFLSVTWLYISLIYTGARQHLRRLLPWLLIVPVLTNVIIWTNPLHHLWRGDSYRDLTTTWFPISVYNYEWWFYNVHIPFAFILTFLATFFLLRSLLFRNKVYRVQIIVMLAALYLPLTLDIIDRMGFEPIPYYNSSTLVFPISGLLVGWSLLRLQFLNLMPIARDRVVENMESLMVVLDLQHRVVDVNPAAKRHLIRGKTDIIGMPIQQVFHNDADLVTRIINKVYLNQEIKLDQFGEARTYALQVSPITYRSGGVAGQLLLLNDITERKNTERTLNEQAQQVAILEERQRLAQELHDSVNQTLFAAGALADLLPKAIEMKPEKVQEYALSIQQLTHGATAQMRLILLELYPDALIQADLSTILKHLCVAHTGDTGTPIDFTASPHIQLERDDQMAFYRITQEALQNIRKHTEATRIIVKLSKHDDTMTLMIQDDGIGFDVTDTPAGHFGLQNMRQRAEAVGARLEIVSAVNQGTKITITKDIP